METQISIDVNTNKSVVINLENGKPIPPAKNLDINSLNTQDKKTVEDAIKIITTNAK